MNLGLSRSQAVGIGAILLVWLAVRVAYWPELTSSPNYGAPPQDGLYHQHWARGLAFGDWRAPSDVSDPHIPENPFFRPPGYPYFLAAVYRVFGPGPAAPRLANMVLSGFSAILLFGLTRRMFGAGPALIATGLFVVYWGFLYFEGLLLEPPLMIALTLASLCVAARWTERIDWRGAAMAGLLTGLGTLVRPNLLLCAPVFLLWGAMLAWRRRNRAEFVRLFLAYSGMFLVALLPALARNDRVSGEWPVLTTNGGINLYIGNNPTTDCTWPHLPPDLEGISGLRGWTSFDYPVLVNALSQTTGRPWGPVEADRHFRRLGKDYILSHPRQSLRRAWTKFFLFWGPREISNNTVVEVERDRSAILRKGLNFTAILTLAIVGLVFVWRERRDRLALPAFLLLFLAVYCASFLPFFVAARYRLIAVPLLMVFAGKGIWEWVGLIRKRNATLAVCVALLVAAGYTLLAKPVVAYTPNLARWHAEQGQALYKAGKYAEAAAANREAIRLDPRFAFGHANLGLCLAQMGDYENARLSFRTAIEIDPRLSYAHANLGRACMELRRLDEAETHLRAALDLQPDHSDWWNRLGAVMAMRGNPGPAGDCFRKALELDPRNRDAQANLRQWERIQSP